MPQSTTAKELPETSVWHGAISDEDVQLVRRRHAEKVEEWLDFADFATELFKLHEKYGIDKGEEGYFAYRKHLRINYNEKLATYGPTPDPLDEGCDCIFCKMHPAEEPDPQESKLEQVPAESPDNSDRHNNHQPTKKSTASTPAEKLATGQVRRADHRPQKVHHIIGPHSRPCSPPESNSQTERRLGQVPAERRNNADQPNDHLRTEKKLRSVPACTHRLGEKVWSKKMAGTVF